MQHIPYPANYHTHSYLDDGSGPLEAYVVRALELGFIALGFSGHTPLELQHDGWRMERDTLPRYFDEIDRLKDRYAGRIQLYAGLEIDYLDHHGIMAGSEYADRLDFTIASLHAMYHAPSRTYLTVDGPVEEFEALLQDNFGGDIRNMAAAYYSRQEVMVRSYRFDILGHCDLIKKRNSGNRYFDQHETWYRELTDAFLDAAAAAGTRIEVNTGAVARGITTEVYPNPQMLARCGRLGIPLVISADAHVPEHLDFHYPEAMEAVRQAGCSNIQILRDGQWLGLTP